MRAQTVVVATALLSTTLAACGGPQVIDAGDATVLISERTGGAMDALLSGTLAVVDGCLGIKDADHHDTVVVWPHGTEVTSREPAVIDIPGLGEIGLGDEVSVGGGVVRNDGPVGGVTVPTYCDDGETWLAS